MTTAELEASVEEFFEDYIDTVNKSWTSKNALKKRRTMFANSCRDCLAGYRFAKLAHEDNLTISEGKVRLLKVNVTGATRKSATAVMTRDLPESDLIDPDGNVVQHFDEYPDARTLYELQRSANSWLITKDETL